MKDAEEPSDEKAGIYAAGVEEAGVDDDLGWIPEELLEEDARGDEPMGGRRPMS